MGTILNKLTLALIFFLAIVSNNYAQAQSVSNYNVSRSTGMSYSSIISTGNSMPGWRYTGGFSEDDNRSEATDIGFDFWYNGQRYTHFSVSTNGFIDFSSSTDDGGPDCDDYGYCNYQFTSSSATSGTWLALAPFYDDMTTAGGTDPLGSSIKYQLSGSAPNRVLMVEWDNMAIYGNTSPDLNFQVKLYELTGVIEYNYETMNSGTTTFSYTIGINAASVSSPPTSSELLTQQTANSATFSNTAQNSLSIMPTANSRLNFTPPTPADPIGSLTFTGITNTGMTLNWTDWASNEVGYAIYYSTNGVNYYFNTQAVANATSATISGLLPSTTYYWKVYAVTEGALSSALNGNATTDEPGDIISVQSGRWDVASTWDCNCIPTAADNVIIDNGHIVDIRESGLVCNDLTVGQGTSGELRYIRNTARDLTVNGNLVINSGAILQVITSSRATHTLNIGGNVTNNGTLELNADSNSRCIANFTRLDGHQTVSGSGSTNDFYHINIDKGNKNNILEITASSFTCDPDALTFTGNGTFKFSSSGSISFSVFSTTKDIPINGKIWMNSANSTMNFGTSFNLKGELILDAGTIAVGDAADENVTSFGGKLEINGGNMSIAGRYSSNDDESTLNYIQTAGTLTLPTIGSTSTTDWPFNMDVTGSSLNWSGGTIIIEREGGSGTENLGFTTSGVTSSNITGGILQIGNANTPATQTMLINSRTSIGNLLLNSANATGQLVTNNLDVLNDITLTAGVLDDGGLNINLAGDWLATAGSFV
ncbi:MAG: fibronectin type III domain-containing protein, partial [Bacteroidota bacterium]